MTSLCSTALLEKRSTAKGVRPMAADSNQKLKCKNWLFLVRSLWFVVFRIELVDFEKYVEPYKSKRRLEEIQREIGKCE